MQALEQRQQPAGGKRAAGDKTFAKEVGALAKVSKANRLAAAEELDASNNLATFSIWSKPNTIVITQGGTGGGLPAAGIDRASAWFASRTVHRLP